MIRTLAIVLMACASIGTVRAALVEYEFTVTRALTHGAETIGGPIVFSVRLNPDSPELAPDSDPGLYALGGASVRVAGVTASLDGGVFNIDDGGGDSLTVTASGDDDGTRINGRSLFVAWLYLEDRTGQMFNGVDLPASGDFADLVTGGYARLTFRPTVNDPEFSTGDYVFFDARLSPGDVLVTRNEISEPMTLALVASALVAGGIARRQRPRRPRLCT
jgi:hypothetical protein